MRVFLDANVLVSVLNKEYPLFTVSSKILSLPDLLPGFRNFTSPSCLAIAFYFSEKKHGTVAAKQKVEILGRHLDFTSMNSGTVMDALRNREINDLEDGMQYYSALQSKCDCIVSEDKEGFYFSEIEVLNCDEFFEKYMSKNEKAKSENTVSDFFDSVYQVVRLIPKGRVTSFGAIAKYLGAAGSSRIVGYAMNSAGSQKKYVPAHRVVNRNGELTGKHHFSTPYEMEERLKKEGVKVKKDKVVDFKKLFWDPSVELEL